MASTYIKKTPSSTTNQKTWTVSCWVKRSLLSSRQIIWGVTGDVSGNYYTQLEFNSSDQLEFMQGGTVGDPYQTQMKTNAKYRDTNGWYHIVVAADTTQGTEANRLKIYVNGEQITSFATANYPSQDEQFRWHYTGYQHSIGISGFDTARYFNGSISHFHNIDGTQYAASDFGSTDSTTGEWKINTSPSVTYGSFGTFLLKDGNSVTDQSGRGNNWTVGGGTLTKTEDNPSNVFATMNSLGNTVAATTLSNGNNTVAMTNSKGGNLSTLACTGGKYYAEMKVATMPQDSRFHIGILPKPVVEADDPISTNNKGIMLSGYNAAIYANSGSGSAILNNFYGNATGRFSGTPILGCAVDLSSATKTMAISINGAWVTGSNTTDSSFSNALKVDISTPVALEDDWFFGCGSGNGSGTTGVYNWNFGNGYFGTTAVSSAGTNTSGIGIFEYDTPTGYTALSTKGLNL